MKQCSIIIATLFIVTPFFFLNSAESATKIGIITALDNAFNQLQGMIEVSGQKRTGARTFVKGKLKDMSVILVQSPMGKVNNAITAQLLISHFTVDAIISLSPAGALNEDLAVGDVVQAKEVYQHDFGTWKPYGFIWGQVPVFQAHINEAYNSFPRKTLSNSHRKSAGGNKLIPGIIVSGDQFIADPEKRKWLNTKFHADAVDMGAAAIVQTCYSSNVPVIILRVITDQAGTNARVTFSASVPEYKTTIDIPKLIIYLSSMLNNS